MVAELMVMGGGKMGEALVAGLAASGWGSDAPAVGNEIVVVETLASRRKELAAAVGHLGIRVVEAPIPCEGAVIAVKPGDVEGACLALARAGVTRVLSIAAGVPLAKIERWLPGIPIVRAMPNTPALVRAGAAAIAAGSRAGESDLVWSERILEAVGTAVRVPESLLDAVTGLSGSGPAYVFLVAEALTEAGVLVGLPRDISSKLVTQTLVGSAQLLASSPEGPEALRAAVTSPGGTTAAGVRALEERAVRAAFFDAVAAATERAHQLGQT